MAIQDSGSNYQFYDKVINSYVQRSVFDLSRLHTTTADFGAIIPVDLMWTLPNDDFDIRLEHLLRAMPMVVPPMSRMRVFFHCYWSSFDSLYKHWKVFMSKGRTGTYTSTLPVIDIGEGKTVTAGSLANYLGLPIGMTRDQLIDNNVSALPFIMYQRIYRDYYLNANLFTNDKSWFPDDDDDLRAGDGVIGVLNPVSGTGINLADIRYRDFTNDYFLSGLPFPMRGEQPSIGVGGKAFLRQLAPGEGSVEPLPFASSGSGASLLIPTEDHFPADSAFYAQPGFVPQANGGMRSYILSNYAVDLSQATAVTLDQLRELSVAQRLMEKMARTDGSYGQFIRTFFDENPASAHDFRPKYVGGTYAPIITTEVLQTSESGTTPQGEMSGHGISSAEGYIGHLHSDDYGLCMILMSIMPDSMYCQGVDRDWTRTTQDEFYMPERAQLGPQATLIRELYYNAADPLKLFNYQDRFDEYRYRPNIVSGKVADSANESFFPYTQARYFRSEPTFSPEFCTTAGNVRHDQFFAPSEVPFVVQVASRVRAVRPLPYKSIPAGLF